MSRLSLPTGYNDMQLRQCEALRSVMNSTLFPLAVRDVKRSLLDDFAVTGLEDTLIREAIWHQLRLLDAVVGKLRSYANLSVAVDERLNNQVAG